MADIVYVRCVRCGHDYDQECTKPLTRGGRICNLCLQLAHERWRQDREAVKGGKR